MRVIFIALIACIACASPVAAVVDAPADDATRERLTRGGDGGDRGVPGGSGSDDGGDDGSDSGESGGGSPPSRAGGGSDGGGAPSIDIPSPAEIAEGMVTWATDAAVEGATEQLDRVITIVSGMPAPGDADDPSTWSDPENEPWPSIYDAMTMTLPFAMLLLVVTVMRALGWDNPYDRRKRLKKTGIAFGAILLTTLLAPAGLHLSAMIGEVFYPSGTELLAGPEEFASLGLGVIIAAIVAIYFSAAAVVAFALYGIQIFLTYAVVFFWPLAWAAWAFGDYLEALGRLTIYLYLTLISLNILQAMIVRLAFELPFSGDATQILISFFAFVGAILVAFGFLPLVMLKQALVGSALTLGLSASKRGASKAAGAVRTVRTRLNS